MTDAPAVPQAAPLHTGESAAEPPAPRSQAERDTAARAHLAAFLNLIPLLGVFAAVGVFRTEQTRSIWAARQALQSALFQFLTFNAALALVTLVAVIAVFAWESSYSDGSLVLAVVLTVLPFYLVYYAVQGFAAIRAAAAVRRGEDYRYPIAGRLMGPPV